RLRNPADLVPGPPAVEPQHRAQREAECEHLDGVARPHPLRLGADRLPAVHAFEHPGDVAVVREEIEGSRGRRVDDHGDGELELRQYSNKDMRWVGGQVWVEDAV